MDDAAFRLYLDYHFATCERPDLPGVTSHALDIFQNKVLRTRPRAEHFLFCGLHPGDLRLRMRRPCTASTCTCRPKHSTSSGVPSWGWCAGS